MKEKLSQRVQEDPSLKLEAAKQAALLRQEQTGADARVQQAQQELKSRRTTSKSCRVAAALLHYQMFAAATLQWSSPNRGVSWSTHRKSCCSVGLGEGGTWRGDALPRWFD